MKAKAISGKTGRTFPVLDPETRVPLYQQIFVILRNKIQSGELAPGELVMGEQELCAAFGVSRITARRALDELAQMGLVERKRGLGTRILPAKSVAPMIASIDGLLENVGHIGRTTTVSVLEYGPVAATVETADALHLNAGEPLLRAVRVRHLGDAPMSYLMTWVPPDIGDLIAGQDMSQTPLLLLLEAAGVPVDTARQTISATIADATVSTALGIPAGAPLIEVRRIVSDTGGRPVEYIKILYRPEFYRFEMAMRRVEGQVGKTWESGEKIALTGPSGQSEPGQ
jgi:GntR family transcriptional regulator